MANTREQLSDRFLLVNGAGMKQAAFGTPIDNTDLTTRDKCTITREEVVDRRVYFDCRDEYPIDTKIQTRLARYTFDYAEVTPQIMARWTALKNGAAAAPTGTPANEVQTLTYNSTVTGGTFTLALTLEGRTATTKPLAFNATAAQIQAALTAARMKFIEPGDVVATGSFGTAVTLTFGGRLAKANLPLLTVGNGSITGGGTIDAAQGTAGDQNYHAITVSASKSKSPVTFALGWEDDADRVEKYADYVVESINASASLDGDVSFQVVLVGPWEYDSIETALAIPDCVNIDALQTKDCRISIDGAWETTDIQTLALSSNDNIPVDRLSAFGFDGIDVEASNLRRGRQPGNTFTASIFGSEVDPIYQLAQNERSEDPVAVIVHFGMPGNRFTWNLPRVKIYFQTNRAGSAGDAQYSVVNIDSLPLKNGANPPMNAAAYLDQATAFLLT